MSENRSPVPIWVNVSWLVGLSGGSGGFFAAVAVAPFLFFFLCEAPLCGDEVGGSVLTCWAMGPEGLECWWVGVRRQARGSHRFPAGRIGRGEDSHWMNNDMSGGKGCTVHSITTFKEFYRLEIQDHIWNRSEDRICLISTIEEGVSLPISTFRIDENQWRSTYSGWKLD